MILSEPDAECFEPVIPSHGREASRLLSQIRRQSASVFLVEGPEGAGKEALVSKAVIPKLKRSHGNGGVPVLARVRVRPGDSSGALLARVVEAILTRHPILRSRKGLPKERLIRLAETDPVAVGEILTRLFWGAELGSATKARMVVVISGLDRIYADHHWVCRGKPVIPILGSTIDPLGFLREMGASAAVLFSLCYRDWVGPFVGEAFHKSGIDPGTLPRIVLDYPKGEDMEKIVSGVVKEFLPRCANYELVTSLAAELEEAPQCLPVLPRLLATLNDEAELAGRRPSSVEYKSMGGLSGYLCRLGESVYRYYNSDVTAQALWEELFRDASREDIFSLPASRLAEDRESWILAHQLVDWKILRLEGDSLESAAFLPLHDTLVKKWKRAQEWFEDEKPSLVVIRRFDDDAMYWEVGNRGKERLLRDRERLATAQLLVKTERLSRHLSPLTSDFLKESLGQENKRKLGRLAGKVAAVAAVIAIAAFFYGAKKRDDRNVAVTSGQPAESEEKVVTVRSASMVPVQPKPETPAKPVTEPKPEVAEPPAIRHVSFPRDPELTEDSLRGLVDRLNDSGEEEAISIVLEIFRRPPGKQDEGKVSSEMRNLAWNLGRLAGVQQDDEAFQEAWKLGYSPLAGSEEEQGWPRRMRLLMARLAWNEDRKDEALYFLGENPDSLEVGESDLQLVAILLDWYFGDRSSAEKQFREFDANSIRDSGVSRDLLPWEIRKLVAVP